MFQPSPVPLMVNRHISDLYFSKEGVFITTFANNDEHNITKIVVQNFLPRNLRPVLHTLKVFLLLPSQSSPPQLTQNYSVNLTYSPQSDSQLTLSLACPLPPGSKFLIEYRIKKVLRNFEEYPNDVARGFNIPHMPVYY